MTKPVDGCSCPACTKSRGPSISKVISADEFLAYLDTQPPRRTFRCRSQLSCPVATYLQEKSGDPTKYFAVTSFGIRLPHDKYTDLPPGHFLCKFIPAVDQSRYENITAAKAAKLLRKVLAK